MRYLNLVSIISVLFCMSVAPSFARDQIRIVGSSTVYPFTTVVAEQFGKKYNQKSPIVEATGTGGGIKIFCKDAGMKSPDIVNASRQIKSSELEECTKNGVIDPIEFKIGYDGLVLAAATDFQKMSLTKKQIFLAVAKSLPQDGKLIANPYKKWSDIDPSLPNHAIKVMGPPPTSGTRDSFNELVMIEVCKEMPELEKLGVKDAVCAAIREDGVYVDMGENDNLTIQKIVSDSGSVGIFGYAYYAENKNRVSVIPIDGIMPTFESISGGEYTVARPLYFYVKKQHLDRVAKLDMFVKEFASEDAIGEFGYLIDRGLVPLHTDELEDVLKKIKSMDNASS